ncbi:MAG: glutathione S-transferase [Hydrogenophilales bacterium RIFOXYD1_FULL_62_11]|nr:MAG: glutathione S-transferase [Hydrogenophilales bacterium RIFOXYD1_FULL_62_11]
MNSPASLRPTQPVKLYRYPLSGHSHRVELFLSLLDLPTELIDVDLAAGAQKAPSYLAMNPFGQVPVIQDGEVTLADSNAILVYLASKYADEHWLPREPARAAAVQRWLSVAAGLVAFGPAAARLITVFHAPFNADEVIGRANGLFAVMEKELQKSAFLVGEVPTIADIANYSYIAHAPEGNISLMPYPHLRSWLARIEGLPRFVPMARSAVGLAA